MAIRHAYVVTHGDKYKGPNPGMTPKGFAQVSPLRRLIPATPAQVVIGTGKRHSDVAVALALFSRNEQWPISFPIRITPLVGGPESLEGDVVLLADGTKVPRDLYSGTEDGKTSMEALIKSLPDNAVVCAGRPSMILLGKKDAKSAAVYRVTFGIGEWQYLVIEEIVATGVSEPGTV